MLTYLLCVTLMTPTQSEVHQALQRVYDQSITGEVVNYAILKKDKQLQADLKKVVTYYEQINYDAIKDKNQRIATVCNAYNALALYGLLEAWPVASVRDIQPMFGFFRKQKFTFAGQQVTLTDFENDWIRPLDSRIHFVINCCSKSCPRLIPTVLTKDNVVEVMDKATLDFLNNSEKNRFDRKKKTYELSKIFEWYAADWGGKQGVILFIKRYRKDLNWKPKKVNYLEYDWALNGPTNF